jgi:glycosyltransferase involved in cell wall biosynthesis
MKIVFLCPDLRRGGAERQWSVLLPALQQKGLDVSVVTIAGGGHFADTLVRDGVPVIASQVRHRVDTGGLRQIAGLLKGADVIVTRAVNAHVIGSYAARGGRAAHVATEHTQYDLLPHNLRRRILMRAVAPRVDMAVVVGASQIGPLVELGYARERISVIPNGVDLEGLRVTRSRQSVREEFGFSEGDVVVALVAALRPEKRPLDFVDALIEGRRVRPELRGLVVGDGAERTGAQARADRHDPGVIAFTGFRDDVANLLASCDVLCVSSDHEALSLAILEAMALGLPVIATDVGSTREAVIDGVTGRIVPPRQIAALTNALIELASNPELRREFGAASRRHQRTRFSSEQMVSEYAALFETIESKRAVAAA